MFEFDHSKSLIYLLNMFAGEELVAQRDIEIELWI